MVVIVKPVGDFCNLRCGYCFYHGMEQDSSLLMSDELLEKLVVESLEVLVSPVQFIWHGGEPLLAGLPFYERAVSLQQRHARPGVVIRNMLQTNGTLINEKWAAFFRTHAFRLGVSIDGGEARHDEFRINVSGQGTFRRVKHGIDILREHGVEPGFIHTIGSGASVHASDDFRFFVEDLAAESWGLNAYMADTPAQMCGKCRSIENDELTAYHQSYVDAWLARDNGGLRIREIENAVAGAIGNLPYNCSYNGSCATFLCVNYNGEVFPCDRSSHRRDLLLGDLTRQHLGEIVDGAAHRSYQSAVSALPAECNSCEWEQVCNNGCTMQRSGGISGKYVYCGARKALFESVSAVVREYVGDHPNSEVPC
jgi:uncharacterized protein